MPDLGPNLPADDSARGASSAGTQVFVVTTPTGLATVCAALTDGLFPDADRRVLLAGATVTGRASADLLEAFDAVRPLTDFALTAENPRTLVLPRSEVAPGPALAAAFPAARIDLYADGLAAYGPIRGPLAGGLDGRVDRLLHPDLVPGLRPVLGSGSAARRTPISTDAVRKATDRLATRSEPVAGAEAGSVGLVLGHYLSALGALDAADEERLNLEAALAVRELGAARIVFAAPAGQPSTVASLARRAAELGLELEVRFDQRSVESWLADPAVGFVAGCFPNGLSAADRLYGHAVRAVGVERVLHELQPAASGSRIPLALADQLYGERRGTLDVERLGVLVRAITYAMQPSTFRRYQYAAAEIATADPALLPRYLPAGRLLALGLAGPAGLRPAAARLVPRRLRRRVLAGR